MWLRSSSSSTARLQHGHASPSATPSGDRAGTRGTSLSGKRRLGERATLRRPLDVRPRVWFNADLESKNYIVPGLIAVIMMVIAALLTSLTVARSGRRARWSSSSPRPSLARELIVGKLLPYFAIGMLDVLLAVLMGEFLFHVPLRGSVALLFGMAAVFLAGALSMGMLISIVTKSQLLASQLAMVADLPAVVPPVGVHVRHREHAESDPGRDLRDSRPVLREPPQGDLPQGSRAFDPSWRSGASRGVRHNDGPAGKPEVQKEARVGKGDSRCGSACATC